MKLNYRKILKVIFIITLFVIIFIPTSNIFAAINPDNPESETASNVKNFLMWVLKIGTGPLTAAIAGLMNAIIAIVFLLLYFFFSPISAGFAFPFPDQVIFNKIGFLDPNFINPTDVPGSPVYVLQGLIRNLYNTGFVIAGAVFTIAAMVIGIKLAVSTIASDKAHYKQALVTWITGLLLLFTTHFIMLAIFTVNEEIVHTVSKASKEITFSFQLTEAIPFVGKTITSIVNVIAGWFTDDVRIFEITVPGYGGLLLKFAAAALGGDLVSSIVCAILLGQTCAIIIMYLKRLFYSIILGIVAPLIVAADVMKKTL